VIYPRTNECFGVRREQCRSFRGKPVSNPGSEEVRFLIEPVQGVTWVQSPNKPGEAMSDEELNASVSGTKTPPLKRGRLPVGRLKMQIAQAQKGLEARSIELLD
jgi:hypothetical protein